MIGVLGDDSATVKAILGWRTWANEINFIMNRAPDAGSIARPVGQQSSALPLYHGCLLLHEAFHRIYDIMIDNLYMRPLVSCFRNRATTLVTCQQYPPNNPPNGIKPCIHDLYRLAAA